MQPPAQGVAMRCEERKDRGGATASSAPSSTCCRGRRSTLVAALLGVLLASVVPASAGGQAAITITPAAFIADLSAGELDDRTVIVTGSVDLRPLQVVDHLVRCIHCTIDGDFAAADVSFRRVVDLSGLTVTGSLDLHGASTDAGLLLGGAVVHGVADLSHLAVGGQAAFDRVDLRRASHFDGFSSAGATSFIDATFGGPAGFTSCAMRGTTTFAGAEFLEDAAFTRCEFGRAASFRRATFEKEAVLQDTTFAAASDFTLTRFEDDAVVDRARFHGPVSFRLSTTYATLSLQHVHAAQGLDLQATTVIGDMSLHSATIDGLLRLTDMRLADGGTVNLEQVAAPELLMDVESIVNVPGNTVRTVVLQRLEETAKQRKDLGLANDARYALLTAKAEDLPPAQRILDAVFYRTVAGYFVRPAHPLLLLLATVLVTGLVRTAIHLMRLERARSVPGEDQSGGARRTRRRERTRAFGPALVRGLGATAALALRRRPDIAADQDSLRSQLAAAATFSEFLVYKTLLVLALLAIGNSSPTVREVIDALRA